jgi:hypothetical protein
MKIKCPECVKWNDVDFRDIEFGEKELVDHYHEIHDTIPQKEFIAKYVHQRFKIYEKIEEIDNSTTIKYNFPVVIKILKSLLEES